MGTVTGTYMDSKSIPHGFARSPQGAIMSFDPPGSIQTYPHAINGTGTITGEYVDEMG
jgi:hypothetical protein